MSTQILRQGSAIKKKLRKWEIALIVIAIIIALIGGGLLYVFWDVIFSNISSGRKRPLSDVWHSSSGSSLRPTYD